GGSVVVTNSVSLNYSTTVTLNSGLFRAGSLFINTTSNQFIFNGGLLQLTGSHRFDSTPLVVGDGTDAATFEMLNNGAHIFAGGMIVANNGLLKGFGTITGNVSVNSGGTISPGTNNALWAVVVHGDITLNSGSTTAMKLNALSNTADALSGMTNVTYGGTLLL